MRIYLFIWFWFFFSNYTSVPICSSVSKIVFRCFSNVFRWLQDVIQMLFRLFSVVYFICFSLGFFLVLFRFFWADFDLYILQLLSSFNCLLHMFFDCSLGFFLVLFRSYWADFDLFLNIFYSCFKVSIVSQFYTSGMNFSNINFRLTSEREAK